MEDEDIRSNRRLSVLIAISFICFATFLVLHLGMGRTSYTAADSAGRTMGFNDPLGAEHYAIMVRNFTAADLWKSERAYEWVLLAMHVAGAFLLLAGRSIPACLSRWFFALQVLVFPFGALATLIFPFILYGMLTGDYDREGFIDLPFIIFTAQPVWLLTSGFIALVMKGPGLTAWVNVGSFSASIAQRPPDR